MTPPRRPTVRRKVRLVVVGVLGSAVLTAVAGLVLALYVNGHLPLWALLVVIGSLAAVAVPLVVLGGRELVGVIQDDVMGPYGVESPAGTAVRAGLAGLCALLLVGAVGLVGGDLIPRSVGWVVISMLAVALVAIFVGNWRAASDSRRRVKEVRRERGYLTGEQPWSWRAHAGHAALAAGLIALQVGNGVLNDAADSLRWFFWLAIVIFIASFISVVWSAVQKWRRERRGVTRTRTGEAA